MECRIISKLHYFQSDVVQLDWLCATPMNTEAFARTDELVKYCVTDINVPTNDIEPDKTARPE